MDNINLLQAVNSPLEVPIYDNFITPDAIDVSQSRKIYIQSHTSFARVFYKNGKTWCYEGGYYEDQLWHLKKVETGYYTILTARDNSALFYNGKEVNCFKGQQYDDQLWRFEYTGNGYYRIINKKHAGSKLVLNKNGEFFAYDGSNFDDQLWRLVPEECPRVMLYGLVVGARLVGYENPIIFRGSVYRDQMWRLIPVEMEEETCPRYFYIQNYGTGRKLFASKDGDLKAYEGNNYPNQEWEVLAQGAHFIFVNRITKAKIFANSEGKVACLVGDSYEDQKWLLLSPSVKKIYIRSQATRAYLTLDESNEWTLLPDLNGGYYLQELNGGRAYYKPNEFNSFNGPVYSNQVWNIRWPPRNDTNVFEIVNKVYQGKMYSSNSLTVEIKLDPVPDEQKKNEQFSLEWADMPGDYNEDLIDQISERNIFWLEDSSAAESRIVTHYPGDLKSVLADIEGRSPVGDDPYGFQGLLDECQCVYRVCRPDEDIENGIQCSDPNSGRSVAQHVASGTRHPSHFISTTADESTARLWAFYRMDTPSRSQRPEPLRIIRIYLDRVRGTAQEEGCVNLNNQEVREHFIGGAIHRNYARSSREVLFQYTIPREMYDIMSNPQKPARPPKKRKRDIALQLSKLLEATKLA